MTGSDRGTSPPKPVPHRLVEYVDDGRMYSIDGGCASRAEVPRKAGVVWCWARPSPAFDSISPLGLDRLNAAGRVTNQVGGDAALMVVFVYGFRLGHHSMHRGTAGPLVSVVHGSPPLFLVSFSNNRTMQQHENVVGTGSERAFRLHSCAVL